MPKLEFYELPVMVSLKDGENVIERKETLYCCTDPAVEVIAHPVTDARSILTTRLGTKEVGMKATELVRVLRG